jgi:hypothetical protein
MADPTEARRPGYAPLDAINEQFHETYDGARTQAKHECPVFVLLADTLVVFRRGVRTELRYTSDVFTMLKAVAHAPVAIYAELQRSEPNQVSDESVQRLEKLQKFVREAEQQLQNHATRPALTEPTSTMVRTVLQDCVTMLELALHGTKSQALEQFANAIGPVLLRLTHEATRLQLESLHECVERALAPMSGAERADLHVVVTGDHQARARSLGMQYFHARLREPAHTEERLAYAEGVSDEHEAFKLVGTRRLDHAVAGAFFGDRKRLQRDILGDAAAAILRDRRFEPIP